MDSRKSFSKMLQNIPLKRRSFLQMVSATAVSALGYGCSKDDEADDFYAGLVVEDNDLVMDKDIKTYFSTGPHNCGMRCVHKLHVKNGRVIKMTSDGDIPREGSTPIDESVEDVQKRACVRGYSYIKRQYSPDRLKYPLLQTKERGNLTGFKRISWNEAIDRLTAMMREMIDKKNNELGYLPIRCFWNVPNILKKSSATNPIGQGPCFAVFGNASFGNIASALWDAAGYDTAYNASVDMLNSKFLLSWAVDPSTSFGHQGASYWFYLKAKEAGIPIVFIEAKYSDAAATMGTGTTLTYTKNGRNFNNYQIPAIVLVRPGTDCALAAAMCYVIWKNKEYDEDFLHEKCFGFFKGDKCTNESEDVTQRPDFLASLGNGSAAWSTQLKMKNSNFWNIKNHLQAVKNRLSDSGDTSLDILLSNEGALFASPWKGQTFTVPEGESFEEYMEELEKTYGNGSYNGVLAWASSVTGVEEDLIEALALKYAITKPARLDGGGGASKNI